MSLTDTERKTTERVYAGKLFAVEVITTTLEDGSELRREVVRHPGAVTIIGVREDQKILMIRNRRIAVNDRLWELPAGKLEPGEEPVKAAARELEEETGYRAGRIEYLGRFYTSPGFADELMHVHAAYDLQHIGQSLETGEDIEVHPKTTAEVETMLTAGEIMDGKTIAAWWMWRQSQIERARVRTESD